MFVISHDISAAGDGTNLRRTGVAFPLPVLISAGSGAASIAAVTEGFKAPAALAVPEALAGVQTLVQSVTLFARRGARVDNVGTIWWGFTAGNDTQQKPLLPGEGTKIEAPIGKLIDLALIYIDAATLGDGVQWIAMV